MGGQTDPHGCRALSGKPREQDERDVREPGKGVREVVVEGLEGEQACPDCGVLSGTVHACKIWRIKDLPHGHWPLRV